jgi:hypothetical protein
MSTNVKDVQESYDFWAQMEKPNGSLFLVEDREFIQSLRTNYRKLHHAKVDEATSSYISTKNHDKVIMGYAVSLIDLLEILGIAQEDYDKIKKTDNCKGIQICLGHQKELKPTDKRPRNMKINKNRPELIFRPLLLESNEETSSYEGSFWVTCTPLAPNDAPCPPPLSHCDNV